MTNQPHDTVALKERLDFIDLDDAARKRLKALCPVIEQAIGGALDAFYARVRKTPQTHAMFSNEQHLQSAKQRQEKHWVLIANAEFDGAMSTASPGWARCMPASGSNRAGTSAATR
jgi:methyl-accepting chemotaxis protein